MKLAQLPPTNGIAAAAAAAAAGVWSLGSREPDTVGMWCMGCMARGLVSHAAASWAWSEALLVTAVLTVLPAGAAAFVATLGALEPVQKLGVWRRPARQMHRAHVGLGQPGPARDVGHQ